MGLGDLTLLLVGGDSLAQQLHVHLEHRGADIERTEASEALDTIRVAVPDLIVISQDASASDAERIRDGLIAAGKPPRVLALCDKKLAAKVATYKHDFVATLEPDLSAELIASCIESLCTLLGKASSASRPLRSLVADVRRSHLPSKPISASKQTLAGTAPLVVPAPAAVSAPKIAAPPPAAASAPQPQRQAQPQPQIGAPKPIASVAPVHSQPTPLSALLQAPASTPIASLAPAQKPIASLAPAQKPIASLAPAQKPIASLAPAQKPIVSTAPVAPKATIVSAAPAPAAPAPAPVQFSAPPPMPVVIAAPPAPQPAVTIDGDGDGDSDDALSFDISVATSLPAPPLPPPVVVTSSPSPTPLFVETHTATPAPEPFKRASPFAIAHTLIARSTPPQRLAAAAAALLCIALGAAASFSGGDAEPIATHASASISQVAQAAKSPAPAATPTLAAAPAPVPATKPAPVAAPAAQEQAAADEPEDSMVDGELYDPSSDPARAKANYLVNMGHRLRKQNRLGMAEASYLKALNAMPNYARAVSGLVAVHLSRRDGVEALRWAKKLVQLQGKRGSHHRLLGDAYALAGNKAAARSAWQQGMRLGDRMSRSRMQ